MIIFIVDSLWIKAIRSDRGCRVCQSTYIPLILVALPPFPSHTSSSPSANGLARNRDRKIESSAFETLIFLIISLIFRIILSLRRGIETRRTTHIREIPQFEGFWTL